MSASATNNPGATPRETTPKMANNDPSPLSDRPTGAGVDTGAGITRPKTEAEKEADRQYEELIEEEYAKREGGA
ncbi:hypothetical protein GQ53DRAFT_637989 [Thozetella sp. PMI_491]|nr:hypothetical protein GQ53DRAFT_637989 [Thozetella sp. PMI_491]